MAKHEQSSANISASPLQETPHVQDWLAFCRRGLVGCLCAYRRAADSPDRPLPEIVVIDAHAAGAPFPAFLGADVRFRPRESGPARRVIATICARVKKITGFQYVRFHAIFHDENGVYSEDAQGNPVYNWSYVDQIYDGLLENGVRPFVEISFMPKSAGCAAGLSRVLVQADCFAAEGLREVGCA